MNDILDILKTAEVTFVTVPKTDYPRPSFVRNDWMNLNGEWQFEIDHSDTGNERKFWERTDFNSSILVPYAPESKLSGIGNIDFMLAVWYRREFDIPSDKAGKRILFHIDACDYHTVVWVNGKKVGEHTGGYTPFAFDITDVAVVGGKNTVVVYAYDNTRDPLQPTGKQDTKYANSVKCWYYTRTTGIWQTVWLEFVPEIYIEKVKMTPDVDNRKLNVRVTANKAVFDGKLTACATYKGKHIADAEVKIDGGYTEFELPIDELHLWNPGRPELYDIEFRLCDDVAASYFAMRKIAIKGYAVEINDVPVFQRLVLDQGYYGDGLYTAPSSEYYKREIEYAMEAGFNGARMHQKIFEPYYLYWADRLGYLLWGEYPNYGWNDSDPAALYTMLPEWIEAVERDYNHPSIVGWCPGNEVTAYRLERLYIFLYDVTKAIDPMRPFIDTSGWIHIKTDIYDSHDYTGNPVEFAKHYESLETGVGEVYISRGWGKAEPAPYKGQPYFVSEFGASAVDIESHKPTEEEFERFYKSFKEHVDILMDNKKMCAFCYCQWCDSAERERNGFITEDRRKKYDFERTRKIMSRKAAIEK